MKIPRATKRHQIGACPACGVGLYADVVVEVNVNDPTIDREGRPRVTAHARLVGMSIAHKCERSDDDELSIYDVAPYIVDEERIDGQPA